MRSATASPSANDTCASWYGVAATPPTAQTTSAHGAGADHHGRSRDVVEGQGLVARNDPVGDLKPRQEPGARPGGEHDVGRLDPGPVDLDGRARKECALALDHLDLAGLDQAGQS